MTAELEYDFHAPADVVGVYDDEFNVVAWGVRKAPVPAAPHPLPIIAEDPTTPLPMPQHTTVGGGKCLGCEWVGLRRRIRDAG